MDYLKIYDNLVKRGKNRILTGYCETHHIIPRCMGGDNSRDNLVVLTPREHFICHLLLIKIYPGHKGLLYAIWNMCNVKRHYQVRHKPNSRLYEMIRNEYLDGVKGDGNPNYGKKLSEETRSKISNSRIGKYGGDKNSFFGKKHNEKTKEIIRKKRSGQICGKETKQKMSESHKNKLWYFNDNGEHLRAFPDDPRIVNEGWKKGRIGGQELSKKANEKRKEKYLTVESFKPNSKKCMIDDLIFNSAVEAAKYFNIPDSTVKDRIKNKNFPNWVWVQEQTNL